MIFHYVYTLWEEIFKYTKIQVATVREKRRIKNLKKNPGQGKSVNFIFSQ